ncbi:hypothetical protein L6164_017617 [Bauhinia variegata]|uniref:Uncharacterized protein n=1 Tax=Bauhinia variegata TaxID=167791 RepID=A0ACB9N9N2_BAUVA|nr:hypothetical protein L6164_017617 [Bauhinia variegata]
MHMGCLKKLLWVLLVLLVLLNSREVGARDWVWHRKLIDGEYTLADYPGPGRRSQRKYHCPSEGVDTLADYGTSNNPKGHNYDGECRNYSKTDPSIDTSSGETKN